MIISPAKQMVSDDEPLVSPTPIRFPAQVTELMADLKSPPPPPSYKTSGGAAIS